MAKESIGERVRRLRRERHWTQKRLAGLLGISQGYLSHLESGKSSFSAEHLLTLLRQFNVPVDYFSPSAAAGDQLQNALARQGAAQLVESADLLPSERLRDAQTVIREALVSADSARQVTAIAPVFVEHSRQVNIRRLRDEFAALGLENRFGWALESTLEAVKREEGEVLPREWRLKYRRAETVLWTYLQPLGLLRPTLVGDQLPPYEILDPEIASPETLKEVVEELSPIARKWRVATRIEVDDFVRALRGARGD